MSRGKCYHCGEPIPPGADFHVTIDDQPRSMCCPGCAAVAQLIQDSGLDAFYGRRTAFNTRPEDDNAAIQDRYAPYNDPQVYQQFAQERNDGSISASLLIGGITCAACTWLIEQSLLSRDGVIAVSVNLSQSRLDITVNAAQMPLGKVFAVVESLGYKARPFQISQWREQMLIERKAGLRQLAVAGLGMMQVGMFAIALHAGDLQGIAQEYQQLLRWVSLLITTWVVVYASRPFFEAAWRNLKQGALVMDLPVALAIGLAWLASLWATWSGSGDVYFDSVVMFTFFLLLGRYIERRLRERDALIWVDTEASLPLSVNRWHQGRWEAVARQQLARGDRILVTDGAILPVDGLVTKGCSNIDESAFSGEQLPRQVDVGDSVYAGTINSGDALELEVTGSEMDTRLAALQQSIVSGQRDKPALARLADQIAGWFVAGVLLATALTAMYWWHAAPANTLWIALSVLVISCPCALALATPAALTGAAMQLRRQGIIVRGENAMEAIPRATHLLLDKTGTLTAGRFSITQVRCLAGQDRDSVLAIASALQRWSSHPVARAFTSIEPASGFEQVKYIVGSGLEGWRNDTCWRLGSEAFCREVCPGLSAPPDNTDYWIALCQQDNAIAWIGLSDAIRPEAQGVIDHAKRLGMTVELLTGDSSPRGLALAQQLGISQVSTGMSPDQKMERVKALQDEGATVVMVGDGLNDAPVLALADASFAVAGATDLARSQADLVIADGDLRSISASIHLANRCRDILTQNIAWALGYNLCGIPLAAAGYIPPWAAAIGMSASSLLVVLNSLRLGRTAATEHG